MAGLPVRRCSTCVRLRRYKKFILSVRRIQKAAGRRTYVTFCKYTPSFGARVRLSCLPKRACLDAVRPLLTSPPSNGGPYLLGYRPELRDGHRGQGTLFVVCGNVFCCEEEARREGKRQPSLIISSLPRCGMQLVRNLTRNRHLSRS